MYYEFSAPTGIAPLGAATEIIIFAIFIVAVLRVIIVSARKKAEFDQYQKAKEQYQNPGLKPIAGYQPREAGTPAVPTPKMNYSLPQRVQQPFETGFTEGREGFMASPKPTASTNADSSGHVRAPREPKHSKTDFDSAYLIRDRHGSRLKLDPASLRRIIIAKELLEKPVSMREKRGYKVTR